MLSRLLPLVITTFLISCTSPQVTEPEATPIPKISVFKQPQEIDLIMPSDFLFKPGEATLVKEATQTLDKAVHLIKHSQGQRVVIRAYTDNIFDAQAQQLLSQAQAETVAAFFWSRGIPQQNMSSEGMSAENAVANPQSLDGNIHNRRIEVVVYREHHDE